MIYCKHLSRWYYDFCSDLEASMSVPNEKWPCTPDKYHRQVLLGRGSISAVWKSSVSLQGKPDDSMVQYKFSYILFIFPIIFWPCTKKDRRIEDNWLRRPKRRVRRESITGGPNHAFSSTYKSPSLLLLVCRISYFPATTSCHGIHGPRVPLKFRFKYWCNFYFWYSDLAWKLWSNVD